MSLANLLGIARTALVTQQAAVQVASQNLANAATEGYSRQRASLESRQPVRVGGVVMGTGVRLRDVERVRDTLLDTTARREAGNAAGSALLRDLRGEVEGVFGAVASSPVRVALDGFWSAWSDLANHPGSGSAQSLVQQSGSRLAGAFNDALTGMDQVATSARDRLIASVGDVNTMAAGVAKLNAQIQTAELGGTTAGDLRDARDRLLDDLSKRLGTTTMQRSDGTLAVVASGVVLVDGTTSRTLELRAGPPLAVGVQGSSSTVRLPEGEIGAALAFANTELPAAQAELRSLASAVVAEVNGIHHPGTGRNFFVQDGTGRMALSPDVADPAVIGVDPTTGSGDNRIALDLAALRDRSSPLLGGKTIGDAHAEIVVGAGQRLRAAIDDADVYDTLSRQADARRQAVSGVSSDEELVQLMRYQQAYQAATKVVSAVDEMMQSILAMV